LSTVLLFPVTATAQTSYEDVFGDHPKLLHTERQNSKDRLVCSLGRLGTTQASCQKVIQIDIAELRREQNLPSQTAYIGNHKRIEAEIRQSEYVLGVLRGPHGLTLEESESLSPAATGTATDYLFAGATADAVCAFGGLNGSCSFDRITRITGTIVVPTPIDPNPKACSATPVIEYGSYWLGIGGSQDANLAQAGVEVRHLCAGGAGDVNKIIVFREYYPVDTTEIPISNVVANPGDTLNVTVALQCSFDINTGMPGNGTVNYTVSDATNGQSSGTIKESVTNCPITAAQAISERHCGMNSLQGKTGYCDPTADPSAGLTKFSNVKYDAEIDQNTSVNYLISSPQGFYCPGNQGDSKTCITPTLLSTYSDSCDQEKGGEVTRGQVNSNYYYGGVITPCPDPGSGNP
jgi:hypothetical protein